jgi:signal transduction histidine kinase
MDGFSQALLEDYGDRLDETGRSYLQRVQDASQRMADLIDDILRLSRISRAELRRETVDLSPMAVELIAEQLEADGRHDVQTVVQAGLVTECDPRLFRPALHNLLANAFKFTARTERPRIEVGVVEDVGGRVFFVRDNGAGFDPEYADKLFVPFQRLHSDAEFSGSGVGLATVQRIIHRHGGRVWAEGEVGKGATFYFTLGG